MERADSRNVKRGAILERVDPNGETFGPRFVVESFAFGGVNDRDDSLLVTQVNVRILSPEGCLTPDQSFLNPGTQVEIKGSMNL